MTFPSPAMTTTTPCKPTSFDPAQQLLTIHWNINGVVGHKNALEKLVREHCPLIVNLNETKIRKKTEFKLKNYEVIRKELEDERTWVAPYGGVMSLIHTIVKFKKIDLKTELQAVAFEINIPFKHTVCNIYASGKEDDFSEKTFCKLIQQLGNKFIITGDLNAKNRLWGSPTTDPRGKIIAKVNNLHSLFRLNDETPTYFDCRYGSTSILDLSIATANIADEFSFSVSDDSLGSDHFPTFLNYDRFNNHLKSKNNNGKFIVSKADWNLYQTHLNFNKTCNTFQRSVNSAENWINTFTESVLSAANSSIPKPRDNSNNKNYVYWWTEELTQLTKRKKRAMYDFAKSRSEEDRKAHRELNFLQKQKMREAKRKSWENYVLSINSFVTSKEAWDKIKCLKGTKSKEKTFSIKHGNAIITDPDELAEMFADHFYKISSSAKSGSKVDVVDTSFDSQAPEVNHELDAPFSRHELDEMLGDLTGSSAGEDQLHNLMLKNLTEEGKEFLLKIYNKVWDEGIFPDQWRSAIVIPIGKQGKDLSNISNHRGICLLSVTGKGMERMVNRRFNYFLEKEKIISPFQSGFRKMRSTADNLVTLEHNIMEGFCKKQDTIAIFFDLEKAYDTTCRKLIKSELKRIGVPGKMLKYLSGFLENRQFKVSINGSMSSTREFESGLPQGSVLSCSLFNLAIEKLLQPVKPPVKALLFADDLVVYVTNKNNVKSGEILVDVLSNLDKTANDYGFKFSDTKTEAVVFSRKHNKNIIKPELVIGNNKINFAENYKFLGMVMDRKLKWNDHIQYIHGKADKSLNVIRMLSGTDFGSDISMLIRMHKALVIFLMDYGSFLFQNASGTSLKTLDVINNRGMRCALGAFKSTPIDSLHAETGIPKLKYRREYLGLSYIAKVMSNPDHPAYQEWEQLTLDQSIFLKKGNAGKASFLFTSLSQLQSVHNLHNMIPINDMHFPEKPPWLIQNMIFDVSLTSQAQ